MRKFILAITLAATFAVAHKAQAQTNDPNVTAMTAFSPECNFMSKPGYLRYRHFLNTGEWLTYERAEALASLSQ